VRERVPRFFDPAGREWIAALASVVARLAER
jgi:hypothetical protein